MKCKRKYINLSTKDVMRREGIVIKMSEWNVGGSINYKREK